MSPSAVSLHRYARYLMSLASLGQFALGLGWLLFAFALADGGGAPGAFANPRWQDWAANLGRETDGYAFAFILFTLAPAWLGQAWALLQLRRLAASLTGDDSMSRAVAERFRALADALPLYFLMAVFGPTAVSYPLGLAVPPLTLEFSSLYLGLIAYLALRSVSLLIARAASLAEENRGFV